jgi:hypothetical protein
LCSGNRCRHQRHQRHIATSAPSHIGTIGRSAPSHYGTNATSGPSHIGTNATNGTNGTIGRSAPSAPTRGELGRAALLVDRRPHCHSVVLQPAPLAPNHGKVGRVSEHKEVWKWRMALATETLLLRATRRGGNLYRTTDDSFVDPLERLGGAADPPHRLPRSAAFATEGWAQPLVELAPEIGDLLASRCEAPPRATRDLRWAWR